MFPKTGDTVESAGRCRIRNWNVARERAVHRGLHPTREGERGWGTEKMCGRHARYLSSDIASIYTRRAGRGRAMVCPSATRLHIGKFSLSLSLSFSAGPRDRCDAAIPRRRSPRLLRTFSVGEEDAARAGELREVEVKMAGADGAKIGPLFAF